MFLYELTMFELIMSYYTDPERETLLAQREMLRHIVSECYPKTSYEF